MGTNGASAWFAAKDGAVFTSHHGVATRNVGEGDGSLPAFQAAYRRGYRWLQADAVLRKGELVSFHTATGRAIAFRKKRRRELARAPKIRDLLTCGDLAGASWNIELRSAQGRDQLLGLLDEISGATEPTRRDLRTIMISSPIRPSVQRAVRERHAAVALAAPVIHGGVFGIRFLTPRRALVGGRPYDCQQCYYRFVRSSAPSDDRPLRQLWTIRKQKTFHRVSANGAPLIVDSARVTMPWRDPAGRRTTEKHHSMPNVAALALGGGGWRSAFGAIGAIAYFHRMERWAQIRDVAGISGGAFAVAALAAERQDGGSPEDPDVDPRPRLKQLIADLEHAGGRVSSVIRGVVLAVAAVIALALGVGAVAWTQRSLWAALALPVILGVISFLVRLTISLRSRRVVRQVFKTTKMRVSDAEPHLIDSGHRYRIGATGLNDGNLYAFTTHPAHDRQRRVHDKNVPAPLGHRLLSDAVVRSTSLPGLGQLGWQRLYLCDHERNRKHRKECDDWVPDRLVDGGISGIFGRGLVEARVTTGVGGDPSMVVVDGGRSLRVDTGRTFLDHVRHTLERASALVHLARWLMVAFDISYRAELIRVADDQLSDGYRCRLVRIAEPEMLRTGEWRTISATRQDDLNRLALLRDQVHSFSLVRASRDNADRGIAAAIAACALEFDEEPNIPQILDVIDEDLDRGGALTRIWRAIPMMGEPDLPVVPPTPGFGGPIAAA